VLRLQVPATPDPYDEATSEAQRQAVLGLLPGRQAPAEETAPVEVSVPDPAMPRTVTPAVAVENMAVRD
jgi:hypothetical protein